MVWRPEEERAAAAEEEGSGGRGRWLPPVVVRPLSMLSRFFLLVLLLPPLLGEDLVPSSFWVIVLRLSNVFERSSRSFWRGEGEVLEVEFDANVETIMPVEKIGFSQFVKYEKYSLSKYPCSILSHRALTVPIMQYL